MLVVAGAQAADKHFSLSEDMLGKIPPGFRPALTGEGIPPDWQIILDEVPSTFGGLNAPSIRGQKRPVLAQLSQDKTDEHVPLLIYDEETFGDFTFTTRFKIVSGSVEQMAGVAFRMQDEKNYYYVRASALGNNFRFFKVGDGKREPPIGVNMEIQRDVWHELVIECKGNQLRFFLNGKEPIPALTDHSYNRGKIAFWTKSDSVSYFVDSRISYKPLEAPLQTLLKKTLQQNPRLIALKIYRKPADAFAPRIVASSKADDIGKSGSSVEQAVLDSGAIYAGKEKGTYIVTMPLHDKNGDRFAAVRVEMKSFAGQTDENALGRATPIVKEMERTIQVSPDFLRQ